MKLTFGTHQEPDKVLVTECSTWKEMWDAVDDFLKKRNIASNYSRLVELDDNSVMLDYGSWSQFFFVDLSFKELMKLAPKQNSTKHD